MDTSNYFPQLGNDDPLYQIADYSQLMKTKLSTLRYAEYKSSNFSFSGGSVPWDIGPLAVDSTRTFNNTFSNTSGALSGSVNITEDGFYAISVTCVPNSSPGGGAVFLRYNGSQVLAVGVTTGYAWEMTPNLAIVFLNAGTYVRATATVTNAITANSVFRIAKMA